VNAKSHVGFWLCAVLVLFLCLPLLRSGPAMEAFVTRELELTQDTFGERTAAWLAAGAGLAFGLYTPAAALAKAGIRGEGMKRTERIVPGPGASVTHAYNSYVQGLVLSLYVACLRLFIFAIWFLVLLPVFLAALVDGFVQRAIKRSEFGAIRPAAFSLASLVVIPMAMAPLVYLVAPWPVTPLVPPLWALLMAMPLSALVSNSQPVFGRT
jgi:hypothetical protein